MIIDPDGEEVLEHYGTPMKSGRYPWGSGSDPDTRRTFLGNVEDMRKNHGMSESEIAKAYGISTKELRAQKSIALEAETAAKIAMARRLKDKMMSNAAIAERMGVSPTTVRNLLDESRQDRENILENTANMLKYEVARKPYLDVGAGVERHLNVSKEKLEAALTQLKQEGYQVLPLKIENLGSNNKQTTYKILVGPETTYSDFLKNRDKIEQINSFSQNGGRSYETTQPPLSISSSRVAVRYAEQGGAAKDGTIEVRPGVKDVDLGGARYAQVRIGVDGTHYLKGMAIPSNDMPPGVDLVFNTNKKNTGNKLDAMKKMGDDPDDPFGATIRRQIIGMGPDGKPKVTSVMNIVNEEGRWDTWNKNLSSQVLSKQKPALARQQLELTYQQKREQLDEIRKTENPVVRKKLLEAAADDADSAAVHLKAASLPGQETKVILPVNSLKDNEVYAPTIKDGTYVVLIRFPHGGKFEIPQLRVNNRNKEGIEVLGKNATDAIGINARVAERLSGADFDGDTVLIIPNDHGKIQTAPALEGLKDFDARSSYPSYPGMEPMSAKTKAVQMGDITNLISDMTTLKAPQSELARAVRHSMVVIDAEKHNLNYKLSAQQNNIAQLKTKYQGGPRAGASTLITKATSEARPFERKPRSQADGGPIDRTTGKKMYTPTGASYTKDVVSKRTGEVIRTEVVMRTEKSTKLAETDDAHTLSSGTPIETVYANHSNKLKALANEARKEMVSIPDPPWSPSAKKVYAAEVESLNAKLNAALWNSPLERQANVIADAKVRLKQDARPDMDDSDLKKLKRKELLRARAMVGAEKKKIEITPREWEAIQAQAISKTKLNQIIENADLDKLKKLAMPRETKAMGAASLSKARLLLDRGYTQAEAAEAVGVSVNTLKKGLNPVDD